MIVTGEPTGPPATDAAVIEQSWAQSELFEAIFRRYFGQIHRYLAARVGGRIADDLGKDDDYAQEKCTSAKASCREAKQRCCNCSESTP